MYVSLEVVYVPADESSVLERVLIDLRFSLESFSLLHDFASHLGKGDFLLIFTTLFINLLV